MTNKEEQTKISNGHNEIKSGQSENDESSSSESLLEIRLNELVKKSEISTLDIRSIVVRCSSCYQQININASKDFRKHRKLGVITCKECYDFYGSEEFSQDESGYNYCTWCGNGGKLYVCDHCPNGFCDSCIRRNFGRAEISKSTKEGWRCYCCDKKRLMPKVRFCDYLLEYKKIANKNKKKTPTTAKKSISEHWLQAAFDESEEACKNFHKKMTKLKKIGTNRTKSLKQIVKKMEKVINNHKDDLKSVINNLTNQYQTYVDTHLNTLSNQKEEEKKIDVDCVTIDENSVDIDIKDVSDASVSILATPDVKENPSLQDDVHNSPTDKNAKNIEEKKIQAKLSLLKSSSESDDANEAEPANDIESGDSDSRDSKKQSLPGADNVTNIAKVKAKRKLSFGFSESSDSDFKDKPNIKQVLDKISCKSTDEEEESSKESKNKCVKQVAYDEDPKLKQKPAVSLIPCDTLLKDGETCIKIESDANAEEKIDKLVDSLCTSPLNRKKNSAPKKKPFCGPLSAKKAHAKKELMESSSSISLSSDEDEDQKKIQITSKSVNRNEAVTSKEIKSDSESSISVSDTGSDDEPKSKNKKKSKASKKADSSNSSDDFVPTKKKRRFDKLLHGSLLSDDDEKKPKEKKEKKTISKKRKVMSSDEEKKEKKKTDNSVSSTTDSESEDAKKKKKTQKRRRIKELSGSSDEEEKDKEENSPNKGRKNIRKIVSQKRLATTTKEAQLEEKERRKRITERQKLYNKIEDTSVDGKEIITRKMVLEVDQDSKAEIVEIHPDLVCKLKPHQVNGVKFMWECTIETVKDLNKPGSGCILAHCMGLGKTLQVIAFLHTCLTNPIVGKVIKRAMIICPYNVSLNWATEFEYWLNDIEGDVLIHQLTSVKTYSERIDILKYWFVEGGVIIVSYDIFRRLSQDKIPRVKAKELAQIKKHLLDPGPDIVVCDEGHILKNDKSAISVATNKLQTTRRIVLTGTPLQNNLKEYHCMLSFVKPNLLGTSKEFLNRFVNPIINGQYDDSNDYDVKLMKKRIHILHKLLEGCVQRCDYSALTKFLPAKHEFVISVKLSEVQIKMYKLYLEHRMEAQKDIKAVGKTLFVDFNKLRCIWTHPYIYHISHQRAEYRKLLKDEDEEEDAFINDDSESASSSSSSDSTSDDDKLIENIKKDNKRKDYRTRSKAKDGDSESDVQEDGGNGDKQWYNEFISEADQYNVELSGKMVLLLDILKECEAIGDKIILFSQSLLCLDCIEDLLSHCETIPTSEEDRDRDVIGTWTKGIDYFRMDGTTSADFRKSYIDMFNNLSNMRARLFLISTRAGSLGTNLVGANRVIIMDTSWNPSHDVQAIFRVYRFGQIKPVYIYRLIAQGTMEEKIYDRQVTKLSLSCRVVDEQQIDRHFSAADLAELYTFDPNATSNRPTPMVPKDRLLAEMLIKNKDWIVTYHEHDSLLQNQTEEDLTEEERQAAWTEYENEREGRGPPPPGFSNEDIMNFTKDPDFSQDYEGKLIPDLKVVVETLFERLKSQMTEPATSLRFKERLLTAILGYRQILQEKHVKILRMKQEFCSGGTVPNGLNKYLQELSHALQGTGEYVNKLNEVIQKERIKERQQKINLQQQMNQQLNHLRAAAAAAAAKGQRFVSLPSGQRFMFPPPGQGNIPQSFTYGNFRYQFSNVRPTAPPQTNIPTSAPKISEPTVSLPEDDDMYILPDAPSSSNNKTTVVIEEVS